MKNYKLVLIFIFCFCGYVVFAQRDEAKTFLPTPTGDYSIGTSKIFLVDSSRTDRLSGKKKPRSIFVKIWYPVATDEDIAFDNYLSDYPTDVIADIFSSNGLSEKLIDELRQMPAFSLSNLEISNYNDKFPTLIFNPGFYFGISDFYTSMIENLASNGYIVCSVNHPYEQPFVELQEENALLKKKKAQLAYLQLFIADLFQIRTRDTPEKIERITRYYLRKLSRLDKAVRRWTLDTNFFIDHIEAMSKLDSSSIYSIMDIDRIGAFGQSLGGATSGHLCVTNPIIKAGINMDCFQFGDMIDNPIDVPFLLMQSEHYYDWNLANTVIFRDSKADFYTLTLKNSKHFIFSDAAMIDNIDKYDKIRLIGNIDGEKSKMLINEYILDFFNYYLRGIEPSILKKEKDNENIKFEIRLKNDERNCRKIQTRN